MPIQYVTPPAAREKRIVGTKNSGTISFARKKNVVDALWGFAAKKDKAGTLGSLAVTLYDADCVTIRVRFIDETQFEARSPLSATLGQFKSRHLRPTTNGSSPIRANDRVRLIFNGKVLGSDSSTLAQVCSFHWPTNGVCWLLCPRNDRFGLFSRS